MNSLSIAFKYALLLQAAPFGLVRSNDDPEIYGHASSGNDILARRTMISSWITQVSSNVPVTIQRVGDEECSVLEPDKTPINGGESYALVTSDCSGTVYIPHISHGNHKGLVVNIEGASGNEMSFLQSSWYDASWSYKDMCPTSDHEAPHHEVPKFSPRPSFMSSFKRFLQKTIVGSKTKAIDQLQDLEASVDIETSVVCTVNVEVLINGCNRGPEVYAPAVRVLDSTLRKEVKEEDPDDECKWNCEADIMFPGPSAMESMDSLSVPADPRCEFKWAPPRD